MPFKHHIRQCIDLNDNGLPGAYTSQLRFSEVGFNVEIVQRYQRNDRLAYTYEAPNPHGVLTNRSCYWRDNLCVGQI